jgi:hypothetical protein
MTGNFDGTEHELPKLGCGGRQWVETTPTWSVQQHLLRFSILNQKEVGLKLNKGVIIKSKAMNGNQIFVCGWDMKDMIKNKIMIGSGNNSFTNAINVHT